MSLRIIFMGTPDFAVASLTAIHDQGFNIVGVITSTDKYGGRGRRELLESPVKKEAMRLGLNILQPPRLKNREFVKHLKTLKADIQIVVAFRMLPERVWNMPRLGTYNIHGSLLPKYRGAAPIHWAVINGEKETGVTAFKLKHEIDTGSILSQVKMKIGDNESTGDVYNRMKIIGAELACDMLQIIKSEDFKLIEQDATQVSEAPKIYHETCQIDFTKSTREVHNLIRGLSPFPQAWTKVGNIEIKVLRSAIINSEVILSAGSWLSDNKTYIHIGTEDGIVSLEKIKVSGKRAMDVADFLNGQDLTEWQEAHDITIV